MHGDGSGRTSAEHESRLTKAGSHCKDQAGIGHTGHVIIKLHQTGQETMISDRKLQKEQPVLTGVTCCKSGQVSWSGATKC